MIKIRVWYKDENGENGLRELRNLKPRRYMCGWGFTKCLKYIKEELYWNDIKEDQVIVIEFYNEKEHWVQGIKRGE